MEESAALRIISDRCAAHGCIVRTTCYIATYKQLSDFVCNTFHICHKYGTDIGDINQLIFSY